MYDASKHICFNLGRVMRRVYDYYDQRLSTFDLTPSQFFVFNALCMGDGITVGEIGERVHLDNSTITGIIDRMERSGYVERQPNPDDRRSVLVNLTEKAKGLAPRILEFADELDTTLRKPFSRQEMDDFETVLRTLAETQNHVTA
ncbi:MarR family winged helix-turn-helix transcriptional regulator [Chloroflexota bacterium]